MKLLSVRTIPKVQIPVMEVHGQPSLEIERRFLVKELPDNLEQYLHEDIVQGYLSTEEGTSIRLRHQGDNYYQTIKKGTGKIREEIEIPISKPMYDILWNETKGRRIKKTRYEIPDGENIIQLDIYSGKKLKGLETVEVEFKSIEECDNFTPCEWFGAEVTEIKEFTNKQLATHGIPEKLLKQLRKK